MKGNIYYIFILLLGCIPFYGISQVSVNDDLAALYQKYRVNDTYEMKLDYISYLSGDNYKDKKIDEFSGHIIIDGKNKFQRFSTYEMVETSGYTVVKNDFDSTIVCSRTERIGKPAPEQPVNGFLEDLSSLFELYNVVGENRNGDIASILFEPKVDFGNTLEIEYITGTLELKKIIFHFKQDTEYEEEEDVIITGKPRLEIVINSFTDAPKFSASLFNSNNYVVSNGDRLAPISTYKKYKVLGQL